MASQQGWNPPLPPGYEARWDPNQRAYFYINHNTKTTTWQDPRFAPSQPQVQQYGHQAAAQNLNQAFGQATGRQAHGLNMTTINKQFGTTVTRQSDAEESEEEETTDFESLFRSSGAGGKADIDKIDQIQKNYPDAPREIIEELMLKHNNSIVITNNKLFEMGFKRQVSKHEPTSHPPPRTVDALERLRAMYPDVNPAIINDIWDTCHRDEKKARAHLESIGYKPKFPATHKENMRPKSSSRTPERHPSPAPAPIKTKVTLSDAEKRRLEVKINEQFKDTDASVVRMALQVCDYDESRVKAVLDRMLDSSRPGTSQSRRPTSPARRSPSPVLSPTNLEPVSMIDDGYDDGSKKTTDDFLKTSTDSRPTTASSRPGSRPNKPSQTSSRPASRPSSSKSSSRVQTPKNTTPPPKKSSTHQHRAKQVTHGQTQGSVVARQPKGHVYQSEYRTPPVGPDPSLVSGPNKDLLLHDYTVAKGPNPELREGPDPDRAQGPQGAVGPNQALHCGPSFSVPVDRRTIVTSI